MISRELVRQLFLRIVVFCLDLRAREGVFTDFEQAVEATVSPSDPFEADAERGIPEFVLAAQGALTDSGQGSCH